MTLRLTYAMLRKALNGQPYAMELTGSDAQIVERVVNQGIDSHLEACNIKEQDYYAWTTRHVGKTKVGVLILEAKVSVESMPVLLRRLYDLSNEEGPEAELAEQLCLSILDTLGFPDAGERGFEIISPVDEAGPNDDSPKETADDH